MSHRIVRRVLVVDDDPVALEHARLWMPDREVLLESKAANVLERVRNERPCLAIIDVVLDWDASGLQVAASIKAEFPELPVVMISSYADPRAASLIARRPYVDLFLPKQGRRTFDEILAFVESRVEPEPFEAHDDIKRESRRDYARRLLAQSRGIKAEAARRGGVTWATLQRWLNEDDEAAPAAPTGGGGSESIASTPSIRLRLRRATTRYPAPATDSR